MIAEVAACVPASLAAYGDSIALGPGGPAAVPLAALRDPAVFDVTLSAFAAGVGVADRHALVSYWSQFYFATLATPALTALVCLGRPLPLAFETASLESDASGRPARLFVPADGSASSLGDIPGLAGLVETHLRPFVELCHARCGLAPRVLWGNAAVILDHVAGELGGRDRLGYAPALGEDAPACAEVAACLGWRGGSSCAKSPLAQALCSDASGCRRRRTCCLRHRLPGVPSCGALCPLERTDRRPCDR